MMNADLHLKVILFVKGRGSDASIFRPHQDETQWWSRRDALVRCVAAFLCGPRCASTKRSLVLVYDEDWAQMHMTFDDGANTESLKEEAATAIPMEKNIVSLWKQAAASADGSKVTSGGFVCRLEKSSHLGSQGKSSHFSGSGDMSKRDLLERLQKSCSLDFLRKHGLNSAPGVVLRKKNRKDLAQVWNEWTTKTVKKSPRGDKLAPLKTILNDILQPDDASVNNVVAGILHESSDNELPCFEKKDMDHVKSSNEAQTTAGVQICLFLGAVRDMYPRELTCLEEVCRTASQKQIIPLVRIRLSPVPEFTSKILSVVAWHDACGKLWPSIHSLSNRIDEKSAQTSTHRKRPRDDVEVIGLGGGRSRSLRLHVVCLIPLMSSCLSSRLEERTALLWCLVRCTVVTLWRSRLASSTTATEDWTSTDIAQSNPLCTAFTVLFGDGTSITLHQDKLLSSMAEQHRAAPSEHQVLEALLSQLRTELPSPSESPTQHAVAWGDIASRIIGDVTAHTGPCFLLDTAQKASSVEVDLAPRFYDSRMPTRDNDAVSYTAIALVSLDGSPSSETQYVGDGVDEIMRKAFVQAARSSSDVSYIPVRVLPRTDCPDYQACTITMLQHFCYQNQLVRMLSCYSHQHATIDDSNVDEAASLRKLKKSKKRIRKKDKHG